MRMQLSQLDGKAIIRDRGETLPPAPSQGFEVSAQYLFSMLPTASTNIRHSRLYRFFVDGLVQSQKNSKQETHSQRLQA